MWLQVVLEPPTSLAAYVRGMLQLVAHPTAAYVGFFAKVRAQPSQNIPSNMLQWISPPAQAPAHCSLVLLFEADVPACAFLLVAEL
jgi:hypothetical protein